MIERINPQNIIRVLAVVLEIMCFVPVFLVSCDGKVTEVCMKTAITGHEDAGIEADMFYLWAFIIPILILGIWFFKERIQKIAIRVIVLALAAMDIALWVSFKNEIIEIADNNYCEFETTSAYTANFTFLGLVCLLSVVDICAILYKEQSRMDMKMDDVGEKVYDIQSSIKNIANTAGNVVKAATTAAAETIKEQSEKSESVKKTENTVFQQQVMPDEKNSKQEQKIEHDGFCWNCGSKMKVGSKFCVHCGAQKK